jgi:hypothetical protein
MPEGTARGGGCACQRRQTRGRQLPRSACGRPLSAAAAARLPPHTARLRAESRSATAAQPRRRCWRCAASRGKPRPRARPSCRQRVEAAGPLESRQIRATHSPSCRCHRRRRRIHATAARQRAQRRVPEWPFSSVLSLEKRRNPLALFRPNSALYTPARTISAPKNAAETEPPAEMCRRKLATPAESTRPRRKNGMYNNILQQQCAARHRRSTHGSPQLT